MKNKYLSGSLFTKKALTIKEAPLSDSIRVYLDRKQIYNDRLNSGKLKVGSRMIHLCKKGTPDRFAIVAGRIIFIEVKMKDKKPTPEQLERHQELERSGAIVLVAHSLEDFISQFKKNLDYLRNNV
jgi:hypothetical protein